MQSSKPIQILQTFSAAEWKKFEEFLLTPSLNRNQRLLAFYRWLVPYRARLADAELKRGACFELLFPGEAFDDKKWRYLLSDLAGALEEFLAWSAFRQDSFARDLALLRSYQERKLDKYFQAALQQLDKRLEEHPYRDAHYFNTVFRREELLFQFESSRKSHQTSTNLQQVVDSLDVLFLANKLRYSCEIINNKGVVNVDYHLFLLDEIRDYLRDRNLERYPVIAIYHQILLTLQDPGEVAHYRKLLMLLEENRQLFSPAEVFDMYIYAKNYCIIKINKGNVEFTRELFEFYKTILNAGILLREGRMTQWDFKNMVSLALRLSEYDWTERFMDEYRQAIDPAERNNVWSFNRANLEFHRGRYDLTLKLLQKVEFNDLYYHLDAKALMLKTYYETQEWDSLQSLLDAFKVYLKRNRAISAYQRAVYGNLVRFSAALLRYRRGGRVSLDQLAGRIEECREIANLTWLKDAVEKARHVPAARVQKAR